MDLKNKLEVGAGTCGAIIISKDLRNDDKNTMGLSLYGDYKVSDNFTTGLELSNAFGYSGKGVFKGSEVKETTIGLRGRYVKPMDFGSRKGDVYGLVGIANHKLSTDPSSSFHENDIGFSFGGGIDLQLTPKVLAGFELRYHVLRGSGSYGMDMLVLLLKVDYCF